MSKKDEIPEIHDPLYSDYSKYSTLNKPSQPVVSKKRKTVAEIPEMEEPDPVPSRVSSLPNGDRPVIGTQTAKVSPKAMENYEGSGIDLPDSAFDVWSEEEQDPFADEFEGTLKIAFLCSGQGAGKLGSAFYDLGYRKMLAVNTTEQDFQGLSIPNTMVIGNNRGGAGKDIEVGKLATKESQEDIIAALGKSWGDQVDISYICVSGGGGTGSGSLPVLVDIVKDYYKSLNVNRNLAQKVGVILTLPKKSEGSKVQQNAHYALTAACQLLEAGKICSLLIMDNNKISSLYAKLPVKQFWQVANNTFASQFHVFNLLANKESNYQTFDRAEYRAVVQNGILIFGSSKVDKYIGQEDIAAAIRNNIKNGLLADGFELNTATMAAAILVAHDDVLTNLPMDHADAGFLSLSRTLGSSNLILHTGIYEGKQPGMRIFTMVSGLAPPVKRIAELQELSKGI